MKNCLNFNIHKTLKLKKYRFFDIGNDNFYFDDYVTRAEIEENERMFLLPVMKLVKELSEKYGTKFKCSFTISGIELELLEEYSPHIIQMMAELSEMGNIEFVGMPYNHSLCGIADNDEFVRQVVKHSDAIERLFGVRPTVFRNTELIYTDDIGETVYDLGFKSVLVEGTGKNVDLYGHNRVYYNPKTPRLKLIPRDEDLSRMMQDALKDRKLFTPEYFAQKFLDYDDTDELVYVGINSQDFTVKDNSCEQVIKFLYNLGDKLIESDIVEFLFPSEIAAELQPVGPYHAPVVVSGMNRYHDLTPWLGNELQQEAFHKITSYGKLVKTANSPKLAAIWEKLQISDYFFYMSTDYFNNPAYGYKPNPFKSPYEAFINYMNIISDLERRLNEKVKEDEKDSLSNQEIMDIISRYEKVIHTLKQKLDSRKEE